MHSIEKYHLNFSQESPLILTHYFDQLPGTLIILTIAAIDTKYSSNLLHLSYHCHILQYNYNMNCSLQHNLG